MNQLFSKFAYRQKKMHLFEQLLDPLYDKLQFVCQIEKCNCTSCRFSDVPILNTNVITYKVVANYFYSK